MSVSGNGGCPLVTMATRHAEVSASLRLRQQFSTGGNFARWDGMGGGRILGNVQRDF